MFDCKRADFDDYDEEQLAELEEELELLAFEADLLQAQQLAHDLAYMIQEPKYESEISSSEYTEQSSSEYQSDGTVRAAHSDVDQLTDAETQIEVPTPQPEEHVRLPEQQSFQDSEQLSEQFDMYSEPHMDMTTPEFQMDITTYGDDLSGDIDIASEEQRRSLQLEQVLANHEFALSVEQFRNIDSPMPEFRVPNVAMAIEEQMADIEAQLREAAAMRAQQFAREEAEVAAGLVLDINSNIAKLGDQHADVPVDDQMTTAGEPPSVKHDLTESEVSAEQLRDLGSLDIYSDSTRHDAELEEQLADLEEELEVVAFEAELLRVQNEVNEVGFLIDECLVDSETTTSDSDFASSGFRSETESISESLKARKDELAAVAESDVDQMSDLTADQFGSRDTIVEQPVRDTQSLLTTCPLIAVVLQSYRAAQTPDSEALMAAHIQRLENLDVSQVEGSDYFMRPESQTFKDSLNTFAEGVVNRATETDATEIDASAQTGDSLKNIQQPQLEEEDTIGLALPVDATLRRVQFLEQPKISQETAGSFDSDAIFEQELAHELEEMLAEDLSEDVAIMEETPSVQKRAKKTKTEISSEVVHKVEAVEPEPEPEKVDVLEVFEEFAAEEPPQAKRRDKSPKKAAKEEAAVTEEEAVETVQEVESKKEEPRSVDSGFAQESDQSKRALAQAEGEVGSEAVPPEKAKSPTRQKAKKGAKATPQTEATVGHEAIEVTQKQEMTSKPSDQKQPEKLTQQSAESAIVAKPEKPERTPSPEKRSKKTKPESSSDAKQKAEETKPAEVVEEAAPEAADEPPKAKRRDKSPKKGAQEAEEGRAETQAESPRPVESSTVQDSEQQAPKQLQKDAEAEPAAPEKAKSPTREKAKKGAKAPPEPEPARGNETPEVTEQREETTKTPDVESKEKKEKEKEKAKEKEKEKEKEKKEKEKEMEKEKAKAKEKEKEKEKQRDQDEKKVEQKSDQKPDETTQQAEAAGEHASEEAPKAKRRDKSPKKAEQTKQSTEAAKEAESKEQEPQSVEAAKDTKKTDKQPAQQAAQETAEAEPTKAEKSKSPTRQKKGAKALPEPEPAGQESVEAKQQGEVTEQDRAPSSSEQSGQQKVDAPSRDTTGEAQQQKSDQPPAEATQQQEVTAKEEEPPSTQKRSKKTKKEISSEVAHKVELEMKPEPVVAKVELAVEEAPKAKPRDKSPKKAAKEETSPPQEATETVHEVESKKEAQKPATKAAQPEKAAEKVREEPTTKESTAKDSTAESSADSRVTQESRADKRAERQSAESSKSPPRKAKSDTNAARQKEVTGHESTDFRKRREVPRESEVVQLPRTVRQSHSIQPIASSSRPDYASSAVRRASPVRESRRFETKRYETAHYDDYKVRTPRQIEDVGTVALRPRSEASRLVQQLRDHGDYLRVSSASPTIASGERSTRGRFELLVQVNERLDSLRSRLTISPSNYGTVARVSPQVRSVSPMSLTHFKSFERPAYSGVRSPCRLAYLDICCVKRDTSYNARLYVRRRSRSLPPCTRFNFNLRTSDDYKVCLEHLRLSYADHAGSYSPQLRSASSTSLPQSLPQQRYSSTLHLTYGSTYISPRESASSYERQYTRRAESLPPTSRPTATSTSYRLQVTPNYEESLARLRRSYSGSLVHLSSNYAKRAASLPPVSGTITVVVNNDYETSLGRLRWRYMSSESVSSNLRTTPSRNYTSRYSSDRCLSMRRY